jgi:hypothetical protein
MSLPEDAKVFVVTLDEIDFLKFFAVCNVCGKREANSLG